MPAVLLPQMTAWSSCGATRTRVASRSVHLDEAIGSHCEIGAFATADLAPFGVLPLLETVLHDVFSFSVVCRLSHRMPAFVRVLLLWLHLLLAVCHRSGNVEFSLLHA